MNRIAAIIIATLTGSILTVSPAAAEATSAAVVASADCTHFAVTVTGLNVGESVIVGIGAQPPFGFTVGGPYDGWAPIDGGAWGDLPVGLYESTHVFDATITFAGPGDPVRLFEQHVDCTPPEPVVVVPEPEPVTFEPSVLFPGLELADPW